MRVRGKEDWRVEKPSPPVLGPFKKILDLPLTEFDNIFVIWHQQPETDHFATYTLRNYDTVLRSWSSTPDQCSTLLRNSDGVRRWRHNNADGVCDTTADFAATFPTNYFQNNNDAWCFMLACKSKPWNLWVILTQRISYRNMYRCIGLLDVRRSFCSRFQRQLPASRCHARYWLKSFKFCSGWLINFFDVRNFLAAAQLRPRMRLKWPQLRSAYRHKRW